MNAEDIKIGDIVKIKNWKLMPDGWAYPMMELRGVECEITDIETGPLYDHDYDKDTYAFYTNLGSWVFRAADFEGAETIPDRKNPNVKYKRKKQNG